MSMPGWPLWICFSLTLSGGFTVRFSTFLLECLYVLFYFSHFTGSNELEIVKIVWACTVYVKIRPSLALGSSQSFIVKDVSCSLH